MEKKDIEELLDKYFKTLEQQQKEQEEINKSNSEKTAKQIEELQIQLSDDVEFRTQLLTALETSNYNTQFNNNILFWSIVVSGTILMCVLIYKFLKIFM